VRLVQLIRPEKKGFSAWIYFDLHKA
jgi:hypothetical protein